MVQVTEHEEQGKVKTLFERWSQFFPHKEEEPALPATPSASDAVEEDLAFIRAHVREIMERERHIYFTLRDTLPPLRGVTRPLALCLYESMDAGSVLLDAALKQVENTARLVIEYARG